MQKIKSPKITLKQTAATDKKIYTIGEITKAIRFSLESAFTGIWLEGEVSNFIKHTSGHCYLSLKDADSVLSCVIFKNIADKLNFEIEAGMHIVCFGRVSVYEKRGQYQFYIDKAEPKGVGALQIAFEQLKNKLKDEGLFDEAHKKPIPLLPRTIGVITSPTGAAIRDIFNVIERRFPDMHIIVYPAKVQGQDAKEQIVEGIGTFNRLGNVDVIIAGRGGGSLEDLWAFNEEIVARAIYNSEIPVISAVGHEVDYTIADFTSDLRAPTPSAAAEIVAGRKEDFISSIDNLKQRLTTALLTQIDLIEQKLKALQARYAFKQPLVLVEQYYQRIDELTKALSQSKEHILQKEQLKFSNLLGKLKALNPTAILKRGYSITTRVSDGTIIKKSAEIEEGELMKTKLGHGEIISTVCK